MANSRLANGDRKARLCDISWMARKRFWLAVAPTTYASAQNFQDQKGVSRKMKAQVICRATTKATTYLVNGSGPQSFVTWREQMISCLISHRELECARRTSGCALMIASLLVRCGSSVYVQKKSCAVFSASLCAAPLSWILPSSVNLPLAALRLAALVVTVEEFAIVWCAAELVYN